MKSLYEEINGNHIEFREVQISALVSADTDYQIDIWGQRPPKQTQIVLLHLLTQGKFNSYFRDVNMRAKNTYENLIKQIADNEGITEQLKATDICVDFGKYLIYTVGKTISHKFIYCHKARCRILLQ